MMNDLTIPVSKITGKGAQTTDGGNLCGDRIGGMVVQGGFKKIQNVRGERCTRLGGLLEWDCSRRG